MKSISQFRWTLLSNDICDIYGKMTGFITCQPSSALLWRFASELSLEVFSCPLMLVLLQVLERTFGMCRLPRSDDCTSRKGAVCWMELIQFRCFSWNYRHIHLASLLLQHQSRTLWLRSSSAFLYFYVFLDSFIGCRCASSEFSPVILLPCWACNY